MTKLTNKQANAISNMVGNGGNVTKAMKAAGYSPATAHTPSKLTKSPAVREAIRVTNQELARKYELTVDEAYRLMAEAKYADKFDQFTGEIKPDYTTRLKVANMILKLHELEELSMMKGEAAPLNFPSDWTEIQIAKAWKSPPPNN